MKIELCMGSSCFARGNSSALTALESFIDENGLADSIELEGHLCMGRCSKGPHVTIDGKEYSSLDDECIIDLVKAELK